VGNEVFAHYEQMLLFPQCFQMLAATETSKGVSIEQRVKDTI